MSNTEPISIGANCVLQVRNRFFLVVEIEVEAGNVAFEQFVIIRISRQEARALLAAGVMRCEVTNRAPMMMNNVEVEFVCVLIVDGEAFALFDVENNTDEAVFVRISIAEAGRLIRRGAHRCTVIDRLRH